MLQIDGYVTALQQNGGITVYFREIVSRLARDKRDFLLDGYAKTPLTEAAPPELVTWNSPRFLERFRPAPVSPSAQLFHSSYYRLPERPVPVVTTIHDFIWEKVVKGARSVPHSIIKKRAILGADAVICVSEATRRDLMELVPSYSSSQVHVIHNGVSEAFFPLAIPTTLKQRPFVLFVGSRAGYKNFELAMRAIAVLGEHDLIAVGGGNLSSREKELANAIIPGRMQHVGHISDAALNELYNRAAFLLYPSSYEGFGIPVIESMRAGCPVVAVNTSSIPEVAGGAASLAEEADIDAIMCAIMPVLESATRSQLIAKGILNAERFSWELMYRQTLAVYDLCCG